MTPSELHSKLGVSIGDPMDQHPRTEKQQKQYEALSTRVLILGINTFIFSIVLVISIPLAIATIVLGIIALKEGRIGRGKSIAGIALAIGSMVIFIPVSLLILAGIVNQVKESDAQYNNPNTSQQNF